MQLELKIVLFHLSLLARIRAVLMRAVSAPKLRGPVHREPLPRIKTSPSDPMPTLPYFLSFRSPPAAARFPRVVQSYGPTSAVDVGLRSPDHCPNHGFRRATVASGRGRRANFCGLYAAVEALAAAGDRAASRSDSAARQGRARVGHRVAGRNDRDRRSENAAERTPRSGMGRSRRIRVVVPGKGPAQPFARSDAAPSAIRAPDE